MWWVRILEKFREKESVRAKLKLVAGFRAWATFGLFVFENMLLTALLWYVPVHSSWSQCHNHARELLEYDNTSMRKA